MTDTLTLFVGTNVGEIDGILKLK
jgi:hypothetical protein